MSAAGIVLYGLTVTFASIDWVMSLEPHWFSTMYGVLYIAGQALNALAFITAALILMSGQKPFSGFVRSSHYHDLGKLMFGFLVFWAYTSFSQLMLIWYAALPEEIPWYLRRLPGGWGWIGVALIAPSLRPSFSPPPARGSEPKSPHPRVRRDARGAHALHRRLLARSTRLHADDGIAGELAFSDSLAGPGGAGRHRRRLARRLFVPVETAAAVAGQ
jgi:hypothetical protein